jgi:hypothetical protein
VKENPTGYHRCRYFTVLSRDSDSRRGFDWRLDLLHTLIQRVTTLYSSLLRTHCPQSRLHWRCLVAASNGGRSASVRFPNWPRPQLPVSHSNSLQGLNPSCSLTYSNLNQCQSYFTTGSSPPVSSSWCQAPRGWDQRFCFSGHSPYVTSSLTRGWVCILRIGFANWSCL